MTNLAAGVHSHGRVSPVGRVLNRIKKIYRKSAFHVKKQKNINLSHSPFLTVPIKRSQILRCGVLSVPPPNVIRSSVRPTRKSWNKKNNGVKKKKWNRIQRALRYNNNIKPFVAAMATRWLVWNKNNKPLCISISSRTLAYPCHSYYYARIRIIAVLFDRVCSSLIPV